MYKLTKYCKRFLIPVVLLLVLTACSLLVIYYFNNKSEKEKYTAYLQTSMDDCRKISEESERVSCFERLLDIKLSREGIDAAFDLVSDLYKSEPNFAQTCHALAHKIGVKAYQKFEQGQDFQLSAKTAYCSYGFYHGFMETLLVKTGDISEAGKFCDYVDQKLKNITADAKLSCYHGIGHGTVGVHDPRIRGDAQKLIDPAIALCEKVSTDDEQLFRCTSGVFNAIAIFLRTGEYQLPLDKNDPLKICRSQKETAKISCYGNMNTLISWITQNNFKEGSKFAEKEKDDIYAVTTLEYLIAFESFQNDTETLLQVCRTTQERLRLPCIKGIAHGFMEKGDPGQEYVKAGEFCGRTDLTDDEKEVCYKELVNYSNRIYPRDKASGICNGVPQPYLKFCR